jgi:hypothetical protein
MNNDTPAFDQFMKDRELAVQAFVNGASRMKRLTRRDRDAAPQ